MTFNLRLAVEVLTRIEEAQQFEDSLMRWDQSTWGHLDLGLVPAVNQDYVENEDGDVIGVGGCGTAMCFAGWALSVQRIPLKWTAQGDRTFSAEYTSDGREVSAVAADLLGLEYTEEGDLFNGNNELDDLYVIVADQAGLTVADLRLRVTERLGEQAREARERRGVTALITDNRS